MSKYEVELISIEDKDLLMEEYKERFLYEERVDIYGCCIKLLTDIKYVKERWEENFYPMSAHVRSHGRMVVTEDKSERQRILYDGLSKTAFLVNVDYYGWIKSIALSIASDILEDNHGINAVHGACTDIDGRGVCLIAPSGTGKTTHTYGLLRLPGVRVVSDDWFFVRLTADQALAFSSEKNFYIQADIADSWDEYRQLVDKAEFDSEGRAVVNVRWVVGKGKILPMTTLKKAILLKRDANDEKKVRELSPSEATDYIATVDFCNPHLLVKDERKTELRKQFFKELFSPLKIYLVNTIAPVLETHRAIKEEILGV
ncbi:MAG: HPr kinase/phosphorylase [Thermoproteota archaeon]